MHLFCLALGLLWILPFVNAATAIDAGQPSFQDFINATSTNLTLHPGRDPRFRVEVGYGRSSLPSTACMMNAVNGLAILAELDFLSRISGTHRITLAKYSVVEIEFEPIPPATDIEVRLMVWGLYEGIYSMIMNNEFRNAEFDLSWNNIAVAWIRFDKPSLAMTADDDVLNSTSFSSLNNISLGALAPNKSTNATESSSSQSSQVSYSYLSTSQTISIPAVFLTILATLAKLAEFSSNDIINLPFQFSLGDVDASMRFLPQNQRRFSPPFYKYRWAIAATKGIPDYMLIHKRFAELFMVVTVDGVVVGTGALAKGRIGTGGNIVGNVTPSTNISVA